ncbi:fructosamine kinase family protein [Methylophaga sp.]|uniref:fructosamine kinase family protein n=1 Tax=Methylophaga sp. TaxID=2024840 RepID=UPI00271ED9D5|nr:fructosamine kinase family protein [Methylophaga sp.]MDO8827180.1 fructosamine kinase family protein [Methylophaga sp.]
MAQLTEIIQEIERVTGLSCQPNQLSSIGGGCINTAYQLKTPDKQFFIKVNSPNLADMFAAEAQGLQEMAGLNAVRVPEVICYGTADGHSYLVLEYIPLGSMRGGANARLGEQLARLHQQPQPYFGWHMDNTIGSTPQINDRSADWVEFWQQQRLGKQLEFAARNGFSGSLQKNGERLIDELPAFFTDYQPQASLLHGDLWGGNAAADEHGNPVIFDPACYYGDAETDLAMTELFGGFGADFHAGYRSIRKVDPGYRTRKTLYNLYHIINHLNLFGGGYLGQADAMISQLLAELRS